MTDDVGFAKSRFTTALAGFGSGFGRGRKDADERPDDDKGVETIQRPSAKKSSATANVETRKKAEKVAAKAGRRGGKARKSATVGMRCTTKQKMILLALQERLGLDRISDAAVHAILVVAADFEILGAADELAAIEAERAAEE